MRFPPPALASKLAIVLTIIGYIIGIRQVIGFVFSLELTPVFNNGSNVTLITNIGCYC
jgi:hypothetical protein